MKKLRTSSEQEMDKSWKKNEQYVNKQWISHEQVIWQVLNKLRTIHEQVSKEQSKTGKS